MFSFKSLSASAAGNILLPVIAATVSIPVVMFSLMGYDINPAFLLAPIIATVFLINIEITGILYFMAACCGLISILIANKISPDGELVRHFFALVLVMFAPSFLFLGRFLSSKVDVRRILYFLAIFSSVFVLVVAGRVLYLDQDVRIYVGPLGLATMNAEFLGIPVFASFGVLSLAYLICLQAMIICGSFVGGNYNKTTMLLFAASLFCASFLIIGSDSRSAQILLIWIAGTIILHALRNRKYQARAAVSLLIIAISLVFVYARGMPESRMITSIAEISKGPAKTKINNTEPSGPTSHITAAGESGIANKADSFTTGRVELAIEGFREVTASPFIGNGFSSYRRYVVDGEKSQALTQNSSTHIYYLTLIWKGGILFFLPFMAMLLVNLKHSLAVGKRMPASAERFYAWSTVLMAFGPMSMAWDTLIVPSAGAVAFFIYGVLAGRTNDQAT